MKRILAAAAALMLLFSIPTGASAEGAGRVGKWIPWETGGYDTPEEAVLQYIAGLKKLDPDGMLDAFAWDDLAGNTDFREALMFSGYYSEIWPAFPEDGGLLSAVNAMLLCTRNVTPIRYAMRVLLTGSGEPGEDPEGVLVRMQRIQNETDAEACIAGYALSRMEELRMLGNVRILLPRDAVGEKYETERVKNRLERYRRIYGAEEVCERVACFSAGGGEYGFAPFLVRYEDGWHIASFGGMLSGMLGLGSASCAFGRIDLPEEGTGNSMELPAGIGTDDPEQRWEGDGFSSPEDAVREYLDGLKEQNLSRMLGAFAWETMSERSSMEQGLLYYGVDQRTIWPGFPEDAGMLSRLNLLQLVERRMEPIRASLFSFITGDYLESNQDWLKMRRIPLRTDEEADAFLSLFGWDWTGKLSTIGNIRIIRPEEAFPGYGSENMRDNRERIRRMYGADDVTDLAAVFTIGDVQYAFAPQLLRYGDKWYLGNISGMLSAIMGIPASESALYRMP